MKKLLYVLILVFISTAALWADEPIILSESSQVLFKAKFRELMLVTMDYCIDSNECRAKTGELLTLLSQEIGRALTGEEMDKLMLKYDAQARNLIVPYNQLTKELNYNMVIDYTQDVINHVAP